MDVRLFFAGERDFDDKDDCGSGTEINYMQETAPSSEFKFRAKRWRLVSLKAALKMRSKMLKTSEMKLRGVK